MARKSSKYLGVSKWRDRWQATASVDGRKVWIGRYLSEVQAARAYDEFMFHLDPSRRRNFPQEKYNEVFEG